MDAASGVAQQKASRQLITCTAMRLEGSEPDSLSSIGMV